MRTRVFVHVCMLLQVQKLSPEAQAIIHSYTDELTAHSSLQAAPATASSSSSSVAAGLGSSSNSSSGDMLSAWTAAITQALPWRTPKREDYLALLNESEYGAWWATSALPESLTPPGSRGPAGLPH